MTLKITTVLYLTFNTKSIQTPRTFLWPFSQTFGLAYPPLNSATLSCSSEVTLPSMTPGSDGPVFYIQVYRTRGDAIVFSHAVFQSRLLTKAKPRPSTFLLSYRCTIVRQKNKILTYYSCINQSRYGAAVKIDVIN